MGGPHYSLSEVALSLILLVSAGLMMNSFLRLQRSVSVSTRETF